MKTVKILNVSMGSTFWFDHQERKLKGRRISDIEANGKVRVYVLLPGYHPDVEIPSDTEVTIDEPGITKFSITV